MNNPSAWDKLSNWLGNLLFPEQASCLCCDRAPEEDSQDGLCEACRRALCALETRQEDLALLDDRPLPPGVDEVHTAYPYEAQARELVLRLKFGHVRRAAAVLARPMSRFPVSEGELLVPVPTDRRRLRERGFNQARLLCEHIARETGIPMEDALTRTTGRRAQSKLTAKEREENLRGCMRAQETVRGKRVILVDDVITTGSTASEAARALREAGAANVSLLAACRTVRPEDAIQDELVRQMLGN